jgi:hypothetical protein
MASRQLNEISISIEMAKAWRIKHGENNQRKMAIMASKRNGEISADNQRKA